MAEVCTKSIHTQLISGTWPEPAWGSRPGTALPMLSPPLVAEFPPNLVAYRHRRPKRHKLKRQQVRGPWMHRWWRAQRRNLPAWLVSFMVHLAVMLLLGLIVFPPQSVPELVTLILRRDIAQPSPQLDAVVVQPEWIAAPGRKSHPSDLLALARATQTNPLDLNINDETPALTTQVPDATGPPRPLEGALAGRSDAARAALVRAEGGNAASEDAVNAGLRWLAKQQHSDGSWSFQLGPTDSGMVVSPNGATGLALLSFLGAGHTPAHGEFAAHVDRGLKYLVDKIDFTRTGGDLRGTTHGHETFYVHGICAIALCEAYALTLDPKLRQPAQSAVDFIVSTQDPKGGGWRYFPGQAGDTSVVGWQLMALKSASYSDLKVQRVALTRISKFLASVQSQDGSRYGYMRPGPRPTTTAVGLLCRMYLGWPRKNPKLRNGVEYLADFGPHSENMYHNYYATQVLHHWGGELWVKWNKQMRDQLVNAQVKQGDDAGSWVPDHAWGSQGGRLYTTCLSIMTLEVYYRHLPLYRPQILSLEEVPEVTE